ncbi:MAG: hypothetical protein V7711_17840 [Pseudomonadales bacterium]
MTKNVICMKWGTLYGPEFVNRLYAMVRKNLSGDIRFVCLTDDPKGIRPEVECLDCPTLDVRPPYNNKPWRKVNLFGNSEHLFGLEGDWLYLDLDLMVTSALEPFFEYQPEKSFIVMYNWTQPGLNIGNTSAYRFRIGADSYLLENLLADPDGTFKKHSNSQTYISRSINDICFWPDEWCLLFKVHCVPPWPQRYWKAPPLPDTAKIVAFPGSPNPHEALEGQWPESIFYKKLYKYTRPALWVGEIWADCDADL